MKKFKTKLFKAKLRKVDGPTCYNLFYRGKQGRGIGTLDVNSGLFWLNGDEGIKPVHEFKSIVKLCEKILRAVDMRMFDTLDNQIRNN